MNDLVRARGYATGGPVSRDGRVHPFAGSEAGFFGDVKAGTQEAQRSFQADVFGEPALPSDPRELERKILEYANAVIVAARQIDGSQYWGPAIRAIAIDQKDYENRPTPEKLAIILRRARGIGLNLGITTSTRQGFDVDGRRFHKRAVKAPPGLGNPRLYSYEFYERGGVVGKMIDNARSIAAALRKFATGGSARGSDTVPAMLTPGEMVLKPKAVKVAEQRFGPGFLPALNNMMLPRAFFDRMLQPPQVERFAEGGLVGQRILNPDSEVARRTLQPTGNTTINMNVSVADILSEDNLRRHLLPFLNRIQLSSR